MNMDACIQVNMQRGFGGGEVYTAALCRALARRGVAVDLYCHPRAQAWEKLDLGGARVKKIEDAAALPQRLANGPRLWLAFHTFADRDVIGALRAQGHFVTAFAHMPLYGRDPRPLQPFDLILAVSRHVIASAHAAGIERVYPEPLYGIADLQRPGDDATAPLVAHSRYDWDRRKLRDRVLSWLEPAWRALTPAAVFSRRPGITLGVVSRITPIKQFPELFSILAPVLAKTPQVNLEIFGAGGYASVRDTLRALAPMGSRVRFWGHQTNVAAVYRQLDALLTGLPEKEALGLNIIEAQACGIPVLAPDAPPFDETVLDGVTGLRYRDPRQDDGRDFARAVGRIADHSFRFEVSRASEYLATFSAAAFVGRLERLLGHIAHGAARDDARAADSAAATVSLPRSYENLQ